MLGAIAGDVIGSIYEGNNTQSTDFPLFRDYCMYTDDTVLTVAVADVLLDDEDYYVDRRELYVDKFHDWFCIYPDAGFGDSFYAWADERRRQPYGGGGNGSAMRVSPIAYAYGSLDEVLAEAKFSAEITHDHPEGIRGAQAVASAVFLARKGSEKAEIKTYLEKTFMYDLSLTLDAIRPTYHFDASCAGSVPQAITAFLESNDFEDAVRKGISLGGDSDTIACIAGSIAEAYYGGVPEPIAARTLEFLDKRLRGVITRFQETYGRGL